MKTRLGTGKEQLKKRYGVTWMTTVSHSRSWLTSTMGRGIEPGTQVWAGGRRTGCANNGDEAKANGGVEMGRGRPN